MTILICSECGGKVSSKSERCPHCGYKYKRKIKAFPVLVVMLLILAFFFFSDKDNPKIKVDSIDNDDEVVRIIYNTDTNTSRNYDEPAPAKIEKTKPNWWKLSTTIDEMTGAVLHSARSPLTAPTRKMEYPYSNVLSHIVVGCKEGKEWVYIYFNAEPNLTNTKIVNEKELLFPRFNFGKGVEEKRATHEPGSKVIQLEFDKYIIEKITQLDAFKIQLDWYGQQPPTFNYSLNGSSKAINDLRRRCRS